MSQFPIKSKHELLSCGIVVYIYPFQFPIFHHLFYLAPKHFAVVVIQHKKTLVHRNLPRKFDLGTRRGVQSVNRKRR